jgi:deferrochelatase/peroxidase EfeB
MAGLNFVSFQNTPERLIRTLSYGRSIDNSGGVKCTSSLENFMSVLAGGFFLVPPIIENELFPGSPIFFGSLQTNRKR